MPSHHSINQDYKTLQVVPGTRATHTNGNAKQEEDPPVFPTLTLSDIANLPDATWLMSGILQTQSVSMLYGESNAGKSFLALDWCLRISQGLPWLERPTRQGAVLYIAAEGLQGMKTRIAAWMQHHSYHSTDFPNFYFIGNPAHLVEEKATLLRTIEQLPVVPAVVVIDTLSMCTLGLNENGAEIAQAIRTAIQIKEEFACHVMLIHHAGKGGDYRGFSGLKGNIDTQLELTGDETGNMTLTCKKQRDGAAKFEPINLTRQVIDLGQIDDMGNAVTSCVITAGSKAVTTQQLDKRRREALDVLAVEGAISASAWQKLCRQRFTISESAFYHHLLPTLLETGYVERIGERGKGARYQITEEGETLLTANSLHSSESSKTGSFTAVTATTLQGSSDAVTQTGIPMQNQLVLQEQKTTPMEGTNPKRFGPPQRACFQCQTENWYYEQDSKGEGRGRYRCGTCHPTGGETA